MDECLGGSKLKYGAKSLASYQSLYNYLPDQHKFGTTETWNLWETVSGLTKMLSLETYSMTSHVQVPLSVSLTKLSRMPHSWLL